MKQTPEELKEKRKVASKIYRDNMSPEMKARLVESKRKNAEKRKVKAKEERAAYYVMNKERMDARSKAYHQKIRDEIAVKRAAGIEIPKALPRGKRSVKVVNQPADMTTIKEVALSLEIQTHKFRALVLDPTYNFPKTAMVRIDGIDLYDLVQVGMWLQQYKEAITHISIMGSTKKKTGITLSKDVMLIINWLQASKHVTGYCNKQRIAINSNQFWARWA
jgi:hypothetical protein